MNIIKKITILAIMFSIAIIFLSVIPANSTPLITADGWIEFMFFPPHNEFSVPYNTGEGHSRYGIETDLNIHWGKLLLFASPRLYFGRNTPQKEYTFEAQPIAAILRHGIGLELNNNVSLRLTHGRQVSLNDEHLREPLYWNSISIRIKFGDSK